MLTFGAALKSFRSATYSQSSEKRLMDRTLSVLGIICRLHMLEVSGILFVIDN